MDKLIAIFIPTFNRASALHNTLSKTIHAVSRYNINIYISDNASTDNTEEIVLSWKRKYPCIYYTRNSENIGIDKNMLNVLNYESSKYVLMLGDDDYITDVFVEKLSPYLKKEYDFIVLGCNKKYSTREFLEINKSFLFLHDKMPYGTLIMRTKRIAYEQVMKYIGTYHAYSAIPWELITHKSGKGICLYYNEQPLVVLGTIEKTWKLDSLDIYWRGIPLWYSLLPIASVEKQKAYKKYKSISFSFRMFANIKLSLNKISYSPTVYFSFIDKTKLLIVSLLPYSVLHYIGKIKKMI